MPPLSRSALLVVLSALAIGANARMLRSQRSVFNNFVDLLKGVDNVNSGIAISLEQAFKKMEDAKKCHHVLPVLAETLLQELNLYYYYGSSVSQRVVVPLPEATRLLNHARWRSDRPIAVYASGWLHTPTISYSQEVMKAFHQNGSYNLLMVDWSGVAHLEYGMAVTLVPRVGQAVGAAVQAMLDAGAPLGLVVGHSLGAHVAGHLARTLRKQAPLLIGLDPAGPLFYPTMFKCQEPITSNDASHVVAVHTDWSRLGANEPTGQVDFMPNEGHRLQPGCSPLDNDSFGPLCSHTRAIFLFCDYIQDPTSLVGRYCSSSSSFKKGLCANNPVLTIDQQTENSGFYYLTTDNHSPYCRGLSGV